MSAPLPNPHVEDQAESQFTQPEVLVAPTLPEIPAVDLSVDFSSVIGPMSAEEENVRKRASNVLKLSEENEKLKAELKAMNDRLEAAERRRKQLAMKEQKIMETRSS